MQGRLLLSIVLCLQLAGTARAQIPGPPPPPATLGGVTNGVLRFGAQSVGVCGADGYFSPFGHGLGFLQTHKSWHWRLTGQVLSGPPLFGEFDLCGRADVPDLAVPELGTAGACDSPRGSEGKGRLLLWEFDGLREYRVSDVSWPATGSVMVVTGTLSGDHADAQGALLLLLQRRSAGFCMHKDADVPAVGTRYPQGGSYAEVVGALTATSSS